MFSLRRFFKLGDTSYLELGKRASKKVVEHDCSEHAAAMAYYFLFAMFPFLLFLTTLMGVLPIPHLLDYLLQHASRLMPGEAFKLIEDNIKALFMNKKEGLLSISILLALWSSSNAIVSIMDAMNKLYEVKEGRPFWKVRLIAIFLVVALSLLFLLALTLLMFGASIGDAIASIGGLGSIFKITWDIMLAPATLFLLIVAIALVYYLTPDVEQKWIWISPGAVVAIPAWLVMSLAFSFYINNFGSYNKTYGSIGAVIVLLLWLYFTGFIILLGAVINAVIEQGSAEGKEPGEKVQGEKEGQREEHRKRNSSWWQYGDRK